MTIKHTTRRCQHVQGGARCNWPAQYAVDGGARLCSGHVGEIAGGATFEEVAAAADGTAPITDKAIQYKNDDKTRFALAKYKKVFVPPGTQDELEVNAMEDSGRSDIMLFREPQTWVFAAHDDKADVFHKPQVRHFAGKVADVADIDLMRIVNVLKKTRVNVVTDENGATELRNILTEDFVL